MTGRNYLFGEFRLDAAGKVLYRDDERVPLTPKAIETLVLLVEKHGEVVDKDELLRGVWPDTFVEEISLTRNISVLRKVLSSGADGQQFIETISKRGYRFVGAVKELIGKPTRSAAGRIMLAVLPLENLSGGRKHDYFSEGLTEEMITQLARLSPEHLGVIARTSALQYRSTDKSIRQIGRELGVSHVLEGSVRRSGNRVRIAAQLIQVSDETHLWANTYEQTLGDILRLERDVAKAIAKEIELKVGSQEPAGPGTNGSINPDAYEAYLKGRYLWNKRTRDALENSIRYFEKATLKDPNYPQPYAGLADSYLTLQDDGHLSPQEAIAAAKRAVLKALQIDEALAEAHTSLGHIRLHEFNWRSAEREFTRAIELNPSYLAAHFYYSNYLVAMERPEEAIAEARRAQVLDPVSLQAGSNTAAILYHARRYDLAIEQSLKVLDMDPNYARAHEDLGRAYEQQGMCEEAIRAFRKAVELSGRGPGYLASLAHAYGLLGRRKGALRLFRELRQIARKKYVSSYVFAIACVGLGYKDEALAWLQRACEERSSTCPFLKVNPRLAPLRSDRRFQDLVRRLNFPN